jgi:predicted acetyltransferase
MNVDIQEASIEEKSILRNLMELCRHDYSEFNGEDVDEHGLFGYKHLDHYWTESGRYPFIVRVSGRLAGFILVRAIDEATYSIAEFFIMRKYRRRGIGQTVAHRIFDMFPGQWRVAQEEGNLPAQAFWRKVISRYTNGGFGEVQDDNRKVPIQEFSTNSVSEEVES